MRGGLALSLERETLVLVNALGAEAPIPEQEFLLLSLKTTADLEWLNKFLGKPSRWWRTLGRSQPLMQEFLQAIKPRTYTKTR